MKFKKRLTKSNQYKKLVPLTFFIFLHNDIKLFEGNQIRSIWDNEREEWYFSIVDIVGVLTESKNPRKYWSVLKTRLKKEGNELATICSQLKMKATDGKMRSTDVADMQGVFRII